MSVFRTCGIRRLIIGVLCGLMAIASGCSALRIGYGTAPDLAYWWLDAYVDFDTAQTTRVREALSQWFAWNRRTQLPDYAALLAKARTEVLADVTPARVCEWQVEGVKRAQTAFDRIAPAVADLVLTITPEQVRNVERRYAKNNEEFRDEYLQPEPASRAAANVKRTVDRAETLYGSFDAGQRARIAAGLARSPFDADAWLEERRQRQQDALQLLRKFGSTGAGRDQALAALNGYAQGLQNSPREPYRRYAQRLEAFNCAFAAALHNGTTASQRRKAADNLAGWEADLRAIAAARESRSGANPSSN